MAPLSTPTTTEETLLLLSDIEGIGIDYDVESDQVYYSDYNGIIGRLDSDGSNHEIINNMGVQSTVGIDVVRLDFE